MNRELDAISEVLLILTKEMMENPTTAIKDAFRYVSRETITNTLASKSAYFDFYNKTGKDIRSFDWRKSIHVSTKNGESFNIHSIYTGDHIQTCSDFKKELESAYKKGTLTREFIKEKLKNRHVCWITQEENKRLNSLKYKSNRINPEKAYQEAGIEIYNESNYKITPKLKVEAINSKKFSSTENKSIHGKKAKIGETFTFTNEKVYIKKGVLAYAAYNEAGRQVGLVFETLDSRTPAYKNAELSFFDKYKNKSFCRFTSYNERISWFSLREKIEKEGKVKIYID